MAGIRWWGSDGGDKMARIRWRDKMAGTRKGKLTGIR